MTHGKFPSYPIGQFPYYPHETEYLTGSPTYTDDLARKTEFMRYLGHRVWEYDKEMAIRLAAWDKNLEDFPEDVKKLLQQWMDDGSLDEIINEHIFSMKADKTWVTENLDLLASTLRGEMDDLETEWLNQLNRVKEGYVFVTDYGAKGDGVTDDTAAVQAAFADAAGKTVLFPPGVFILTNITRVKSHTSVELHPQTILRRGSNMTSFFINDSDGLRGGYTANEDIHFKGGTIDINRINFPSKCTSFGFGHCENVTVKDMDFINIWQWHYIEFSGCRNTLVSGCTFDSNGSRESLSESIQFDVHKSDTTFPWFGPYDGTPCVFGTVRDNIFKHGRGVGTHSNVEGQYHKHILIENNRFENMRDYGVNTFDYHDSTIRGNTFDGGTSAIYILTSVKGATKNLTIEDNKIYNMIESEDGHGIHVAENAVNVFVKNNIVDKCNWHGILVNRADFGEVTGNIVTGAQRAGVYIRSCFNLLVQGNAAHGNVVAQGGYYDLQLGQDIGTQASATDLVITGNNVGAMGVRVSVNCGVFHNHADSISVGSIATDLLMKDNCVGGVWV